MTFKNKLQSRLDSLFSVKTDKPFNGVALLAINENVIFQYKQGFADVESKDSIEWDSYFLIGSISKQITAYLILLEHDKGTLQLNDAISDYLPHITEEWVNKVTIHHLLTHTHGITQLNQPLKFTPGNNFDYSQIGYQLLADILEVVRKDSFANISAELFAALGMEHTFHPDLFDKKLVKAYDAGWTEVKEATPYVAAGEFISTAKDLVIWSQFLFNLDNNLRFDTFTKMLEKQENAVRNHPIFGTTYYGYGLTVDRNNGINRFGQTGYIPGFPVMSYYFPKFELSVVMLLNIDYGESLEDHFHHHINVLKVIKSVMEEEFFGAETLILEHAYKEKECCETFYTDTLKVDSNNVPMNRMTYYFPQKFFPYIRTYYDDYSHPFAVKAIPYKESDEIDHFSLKWYSSLLYAMNEPLLYNKQTNKEIYRFTWFRSFHNPIVIRIEKDNDNYTLSWKVCDGAGGYEPGKIIVDKSISIKESDWHEFQDRLIASKFWLIDIGMYDRGPDGATWIMEGALPDNYNAVNIWCPMGSFKYLCLCLLSMTDLDIPDNEIY